MTVFSIRSPNLQYQLTLTCFFHFLKVFSSLKKRDKGLLGQLTRDLPPGGWRIEGVSEGEDHRNRHNFWEGFKLIQLSS